MATSHSLRGRLLTLLLSSVLLAWAVTSVFAYRHAHHELDEVLDAHLVRAARLLVALADEELDEMRLDAIDVQGPYDQAIVFQVWSRAGNPLVRSPTAPAARLSSNLRGFSDSRVEGRDWRVFSAADMEGRLLVQVAEDHATREQLLNHYAVSSLPAILVGLPLLALLIWLTVGAALRPLRALGDELGRRGPADLDALQVTGAPSEVAPLVTRLNELLARIRDSLLAERRFTSHAAHEIRTPIAAIRAQAEVAREAAGAAARDLALDHVIEGCDRAARLVDQMLQLARIDERAPGSSSPVLSLDRLAARVLADLAPAALEQGVSLELGGDAAVRVRADELLLEVLLRNLVDNAVRHGGPPGPVTVRCLQETGGPVLEVVDGGPGVHQDELTLLGARFFRAAGARGPGSGLGLSIVQRIAESCGARVHYAGGAGGRGLQVRVRFPPSD